MGSDVKQMMSELLIAYHVIRNKMGDDGEKYSTGFSEKNLESTSDPDFSRGILAMDHDRANSTEPQVDFAGTGRPRSTGTISSVTSNSSATGGKPCTEAVAKGFFSRKSGYFDKAIEAVKSIITAAQDGEVRGAWLLAEIDHWDNEKEKVVFLTEKALYVCKYDFVAEKLVSNRRVLLCTIDKAQKGAFFYPPKSIMPSRQGFGIRLSWSHGEPVPNGKKWNPFSDDIPYLTFTSHPLANNNQDADVSSYNVEDFYETFIQDLKLIHKQIGTSQPLEIVEEDILIESYASVSSLIFNQSFLGFSRERGGVSF